MLATECVVADTFVKRALGLIPRSELAVGEGLRLTRTSSITMFFMRFAIDVIFVERGGRSLVPLREPDDEWLRTALAALVENMPKMRLKRLAVERFDGRPVGETEVMPLLLEAGFLAGPRRAVLRG